VLQKFSDLSGGYNNQMFGSGGGSTPMDPETLGLSIPLAAIALASFGGYKLANRMSDDKAAAERRQRIKDNLNRLGKLNLNMMQTVRKEAGLAGTMLNPFQGVRGLGGKVSVPDWFRPSGSPTTTKADALAFKTLALATTYGTLGFGIKYLMNSMEREKERKQGNKKIQEAVKASMPIVSPDPSLMDTAAEENVLMKQSEDKGFFGSMKDTVLDTVAGIPPTEQSASGFGSIKAAALLLGIGAFGAGAVLTKEWADDRDPNRQRIKAAEAAAQRYAMNRRPPAIVGAIDPKIKEQLNQHITSGRLRLTRKEPAQLDGGMATQEVDPTDSLSRNIAVV